MVHGVKIRKKTFSELPAACDTAGSPLLFNDHSSVLGGGEAWVLSLPLHFSAPPSPPMETWPLTSCWSGHPKDSGPCTLMLRGTHLSPRPPSPQPDLLRSQSNPVTSSWGNLLRPWVLFPASRYLSGGAGVGRTTAVGCVCSSRVWLGSTPTCEANWDPGNLKAAWGVPVLVSCSELAPRQVPYLMPRPGWPTQ